MVVGHGRARFDGRVFGNLRWSRCGSSKQQRSLYKAQLCAACHAQHEFAGRTTSLLANYDQTLLTLVLAGIAGGELADRPCTAVPWRTVSVQTLVPELRRFVAAGNLALIDAKLRDDVDDHGLVRRWLARGVRGLLHRKVARAERELRLLGFPVELVSGLPARQRTVESAGTANLTLLAEPSAELLAAIFAHGGSLAGRPEHEAALRQFGHALARAIYGLDALDDHDDDRRRGSFNAVAGAAKRLGHENAVQAARLFVEHATIEAQQAAAALLDEDRRRIVGAVLQQLAQRAARAAALLLGRPAAAAMRPAEAGDCDCACDGCGGCDGCDGCGSCTGPGCDPVCCDCCCCWDRGRKQRREQEADELHGQR